MGQFWDRMSDKANKGGNPSWTKGSSGNPRGRPPNHFGKYLRQHPDVPLVIEKIIASALDDDDPRQKDAWKIVASKVAPDLKAQEIKADVGSHVGVIMMPEKKALDVLDDPNKIETPPTPLPLDKSPTVRDSRIKYSLPEEVPQEKGTPPPSE